MKLGAGTLNPAKLDALGRLAVFERLDAEIVGYDVTSGVSAMPMSEQETRVGAIHRARAVLAADADVSLAFGMEGGASRCGQTLFLCNWGACADRSGQVWVAAGAKIPLPRPLVDGIERGEELGIVADRFYGTHDMRSKGGTIARLTAGRVSRSDLFFHILQLLYGMRVSEQC
ncbi:MAG: DUF84 family protein [Sporolactobacillus sp.]